MIVSLKRVSGTVLTLTCQHVILHKEKDKDQWIEIIGMNGNTSRIDDSYMLKGLCWWSTWDAGHCMSSHQVPLSLRLGRTK